MLAFISGTFVDVIWVSCSACWALDPVLLTTRTYQFVERLAQAAIKSFNLEDGLQKKAYEETIFDRMLCDNARREEKGQKPRPLTFRELADEGYGILNAGTEPTAIKLCHATFFFHRFPHVQKPLMDELATVELKDGRLPLLKLESLPYFVSIPCCLFKKRADPWLYRLDLSRKV